MYRIIALFIFISCLNTGNKAAAQNFYSDKEFGVAGGGSLYFGDLNENYGVQFIRPAVGAFARIHINPYIAARFSANVTRVGYDDKFSSNFYTKTRNLNFQSDIAEVAVQAEFNFFRYFTGELNSRFTPYLTGGIGAFYYDPFTHYNGTKYYLRPMGTEGQNLGEFADRSYGKFNICFPIGVGIKYWLRPGINFGIEIANRLTLTDYMDDVSQTYVGAEHFPSDPFNPSPSSILQDRSVELGGDTIGRPGKQRGNSSSKDQYMMFMINLSFQLKTYKCPTFLREGLH